MQVRAELRPLTSVRGIAAWFVVLYHIRLAASPALGPSLQAVFAKGYLAVDFFFMLSGFVIWLNYADRFRASGWRGFAAFLWRRLARIYPLHLFMLLGALAYICVLLATGRPVPEQFPLAEFPLHLLLVQNWGFTDRLSWNDPAWSISCELAAYLVFPLLVIAVDWRRWPSVALFVAALLMLWSLHAVMSGAGFTKLSAESPRFGVLRCLAQFGTGSILCALWMRWRDKPVLPAAIATLVTAIAFAAFLSGWAETLLIPVAFAALLLTLALTSEWRGNPLRGRAIHYLGEISYATYMVHYMLFIVFKLLFVGDPYNVTLPQVLAYLALTLIASILLHHGVERPAQRWLNRYGPRNEAPSRDV